MRYISVSEMTLFQQVLIWCLMTEGNLYRFVVCFMSIQRCKLFGKNSNQLAKIVSQIYDTLAKSTNQVLNHLNNYIFSAYFVRVFFSSKRHFLSLSCFHVGFLWSSTNEPRLGTRPRGGGRLDPSERLGLASVDVTCRSKEKNNTIFSKHKTRWFSVDDVDGILET